MTKNELIVESCRNMAFQDLRDTLSSALDNRDATIAALRAEVERLKGENEGLLKLDLHTLNVVKGRMDAMLGGNAVVRIMAMSYGEMFRNAGGENFCTQTLTDWSDEANPLTLEVTIRKYPDGKTPEVVMGEMRAELTQLREDRRVLGAEVKAWRQNEPYRDRMFRDDGLEVAIKATDAYNALERSNG